MPLQLAKRSQLGADVIAKADKVTLSDDHSNYVVLRNCSSSQCSSIDLPLQIGDEDLHRNRSK